MFVEYILPMIILVIGTIAILLFCFFVPTPDSYTLVCDGVEYECIDFAVKTDSIELYDHDHGGFFCSSKCSREFINKPISSFVVIEHKSSFFERIIKK